MNVTIAVFTSRKEPHFDWFCDSLANQTTPEERAGIQLILIDRHLWFPSLFLGAKEHTEWINLTDPKYHNPARRRYAADCVKDRFPFLHLPPKPNVYCGPWRLTTKDWFCAANARNTALLYAGHQYFFGVDDLAVLLPGWWNQAKHAAENGYCVCGAYKKVLELKVDGGNVISFRANLNPEGVDIGRDSRWDRGSDGGIVKWAGGGLFGCSFGVPTNLAYRIDGFAPECNACGSEDYDFGIRAERAGGEFFYNRNLLTYESEEGHHADGTKDNDGKLTSLPSLMREKRVVTNKAVIPPGYESYRHGDPAKKYDSDHFLLNRLLHETSRILPIIPERLPQQRERLTTDGMVQVPREPLESWIDNKPLSSL